MALIRDYALTGGVTVPQAYFIIDTLTAFKKLLEPGPDDQDGNPTQVISQKWICTLGVSIFKNKQTRNTGGQPLASVYSASSQPNFLVVFDYDPAGALPIVQGYQYLMSQPYFASATVDADS